MKLHLGCGPKFINGFIHVDMLDYEHVDYNAPVDQLDFAQDNSVELIYACHVLEHFGRHEIAPVLDEWYRVLKVGGVLRVAVPDFEAVTDEYRVNHDVQALMGLVCGGQKDEYDYHKVIFDEVSLTKQLISAGFKSIGRYDWRLTEHKDLDDYSQSFLPHMQKDTGRLMSLNLEAVKQ